MRYLAAKCSAWARVTQRYSVTATLWVGLETPRGGLVAVAIQTTADLHLLASCTGDGRQKAALVNERILRQDFEMCLRIPPNLEMQSRQSVHSFIAPRSNQALILTPLSGQLPPADGAHYRRIGTPVFLLRDYLCEPCEPHTSLGVPGNDNRSASMGQECYRGITLAPLPGRYRGMGDSTVVRRLTPASA